MPADHIRNPIALTTDEIERAEKLSLRCLYQSAIDFGFDAFEIFYQSSDEVQDVAEDISREMLDKLGGYRIDTRILGNVDYRKARYLILPEAVIRQAMFVESKGEKDQSSATLQMSEISMSVRQTRQNQAVDIAGQIPVVAHYMGVGYLTTTLLAHYHYEDQGTRHVLRSLLLAAIPNGKLQDAYNPDVDNTIWNAGRNAPSLGEQFRVRLSFTKLKEKMNWRVQRLDYDAGTQQVAFGWEE